MPKSYVLVGLHPRSDLHTPGKLVEYRDRSDVVRALRWPWECIAPADGHFFEALQYWQSLSRGGLIPEPRAIDPVHLKRLLGWTHKVDTHDPDPANYFFRIWGSNATLEQFESFKGLRVSAYPSAPLADSVLQDYHDVVASGVPSYQQVLANVKYREYAYGRLIVPLADDGRRVTQLLVFINERPAVTLSDRFGLGGSGDRAHRFAVIPGHKPH